MSLDHYADARRQIASIQSRLDESIQSIRTNPSLSAQGRRAELARATVEAQRKTERIRNEVVGARKAEHDRLSKHLFGISEGEGGVIAARDAMDRVNKIKGISDDPNAALKDRAEAILGAHDNARAALKDAQLSGDRGMQKAITKLAVEKGWTDVINSYVDGLPSSESVSAALCFEKLSAIPSGPRTDSADHSVFRLKPPDELHGYDAAGLERLATEAGPAQQQIMPTTMGSFI